MNVERLHAIVIEIKTDLATTQVVTLLEQLTTNLQNLINQPQTPTHQEQVSTLRKTLKKNLISSKANAFSPAWNQSISELGIDQLLGENLSHQIDSIFAENQITPQVAHKELQQLHASVNQLQTSIQQMIAGFSHFNLGKEVLEPGEGEVGILLPRKYIDNRFDKLAKELKELNSIISVLSEVGTGTVEHFELRSLSTTDPFITLAASLVTLSTIAIAVKPIISAYKEILEVRLLHAQLAEKKVSSKRLQGVEDHAEEIMEKAIEQIKEDLLERYPGTDNGRKNELSNALSTALKKLANRVDRGLNIEVRVEPFIGELKDEEGEDIEPDENIQIILDSMKELEFINVEGDPILHLTESGDDE